MSDQSALQAVIFDWAGTILDHGSRAPMGAFVKAFAAFGVNISIAAARGPMGMAKRDHIRMVGQAPTVAAAWEQKYGRPFGEADIDALFAAFEPMNVASVRDHADFIPGALETIAGADIVIDSVADLPDAIERIAASLKDGKRPGFR